MSTTGVAQPTSLKLPAGLKVQLEDVARKAGMSLHAYMVQTLADSVQRAQLREAFDRDSLHALRDMKASGSGYELADVRAHFSQLAEYRKGLGPRPPALEPTRLG
jgi:predicted transcriptional regulator